MEAARGLHLNGRRIYLLLSYFLLADALAFVLVDDRLIWYLCRNLVMSLLQHVLMSLSRITFSI